MNYTIELSAHFKRDYRRLSKKYHSLRSDLNDFQDELLENPTMGVDLGGGLRKVRIAIASKNKGKSGGARIITFMMHVESSKIFLLSIYDKSEQADITREEIMEIKQECGLL